MPSFIGDAIAPAQKQRYTKLMIKITSYPSSMVGALRRARRSDTTNETSFADLIGGSAEAETISSAAPAQAAAPAGSLLGLQEISDEEVAVKKAIKQGQMTLSALDDLRMALLSGHVPTELLTSMERMVSQQRQQTCDPRLEAILDEIELRAAVELAKREMLP